MNESQPPAPFGKSDRIVCADGLAEAWIPGIPVTNGQVQPGAAACNAADSMEITHVVHVDDDRRDGAGKAPLQSGLHLAGEVLRPPAVHRHHDHGRVMAVVSPWDTPAGAYGGYPCQVIATEAEGANVMVDVGGLSTAARCPGPR
jgi:hypothetical protein